MPNLPETVNETVERLMSELPMMDKVRISSMTEPDLLFLHFSLGMQIRNSYGLWAGNEKLIESCKEISGNKDLHVDDASMVIIKALWEKLKKINQIRIIK